MVGYLVMPLQPEPLGNDVSIDAARLVQQALSLGADRDARIDKDNRMQELETEKENLRKRWLVVNQELDHLGSQLSEPREVFLQRQADMIDECRMHLGIMDIPLSVAGTAIQEFRNGHSIPLVEILRQSRANHLVHKAQESTDELRSLLLPHESSKIERTVTAGERYAQSLLNHEKYCDSEPKRRRFAFRNSIAHVMDPSARQAAILLNAASSPPDYFAATRIEQLARVLRKKSDAWMQHSEVRHKIMPSNVNIRWMITRDHAHVIDIHNRSYRDELSLDYMQSQLRRRDTIGMVAERLESGEPREILGSMIYRLNHKYLDLVYMSTDPDARRQYIAESLMQKVQEKLSDQHRVAARFEYDPRNTECRDFLINCGAEGILTPLPQESQETVQVFLTSPSMNALPTLSIHTQSDWMRATDNFLSNAA